MRKNDGKTSNNPPPPDPPPYDPDEVLDPIPDDDFFDFDSALLDYEQTSPRDEEIDRLSSQLDHEKDARKEERFLFVVVTVLLLDVVFFSVMPTWTGPLALLILELIILAPLAARMGREDIKLLFMRILDRIASEGSNSKDDQ